MTREEIYTKVQAVLVDALGVDEEEIKPESVIRDDLGAESIDFLDIMFRLEKAFNIKIPRGELMPENLVSDPTLVSEGKVTPKGIALRREKMPFSNDIDTFAADPELEKMSRLFTVTMIVNFVEWKLANPTVDAPAPTQFPDTSKPQS